MGLSDSNFSEQGLAALINKPMMFAAELAAIGRVPANVLTTSQCGYDRCVNTSSIPHDLVILSNAPWYGLVDALPNTGLHPFVKATTAGHAAGAPKLTRQVSLSAFQF